MLFQNKKVTIAATVDDHGHTRIGVTVRGKHEVNNPALGKQIAEERCILMPFTIISKPLTEEEFKIVALAIQGNISRTKQWNQKSLLRERKQSLPLQEELALPAPI